MDLRHNTLVLTRELFFFAVLISRFCDKQLIIIQTHLVINLDKRLSFQKQDNYSCMNLDNTAYLELWGTKHNCILVEYVLPKEPPLHI